jgi:hypothetical protein
MIKQWAIEEIRGDIKKFLESNENENSKVSYERKVYRYKWLHQKNPERSQVNNLMNDTSQVVRKTKTSQTPNQ